MEGKIQKRDGVHSTSESQESLRDILIEKFTPRRKSPPNGNRHPAATSTRCFESTGEIKAYYRESRGENNASYSECRGENNTSGRGFREEINPSDRESRGENTGC